ncbi:stage III sporulation protein AG [Paenibacillus albicereus]|uniref:Stage III sporulation protein AG n=1 Tax=Paenibacillus albicereus TaxID=2726185 RepID=A0A6H2GWI7_9BACL|nr:stage III sporulation protein AG [Paenibacillus albicereus]QJC51780.1 stage III sporulation protein AG [Paenibacillus albicereus]
MARWWEKLQQAAAGGAEGPSRIKSLRWLLVLGGVGVLLILAGNVLNFRDVGISPSGQAALPPAAEDQAALGGRVQSPGTDFGGIEAPLEARLKDILEKIVGVGEVDVLVTVDSTEENVWGKDDNTSQQVTDETDKSGGKRHVTQMTSSGKIVMYEVSGEQKPVVTKIVKPKVRGVLVVAKGAENATVRRIIAEAVERGMDVPLSAISIVPRKTG